jgi:guanylate kinase
MSNNRILMLDSFPLLIVISAPSGGGKTTLCEQLLTRNPSVTRAITCTTRAPRPGERDGIEYHFLSRARFQELLAAGSFLEHATVYENLYGTLKSEVIDRLTTGRHVLLNIDVQGAASIRSAALSDPSLKERLLTVFLTPQSRSDLEVRLKRRATESPEALARRLAVAAREVSEWHQFDYLLISTTIAEDLRRMEVILEAELMKQKRSPAPKF